MMQGTLYGILAVQFLLYIGLATLFGMDSAWMGLGFVALGVISCCIGIAGAYMKNFAMLMAYAGLTFAWVILAVVHIVLMERMVNVPGQMPDYYFLGRTLAKPDDFDKARVAALRVAYPTVYAIAIWFSSLGTVLAFLMPTPDSWRSPYYGSKSSILGGDPYYDGEWNDDLYPPPPAHYGDPYGMPYMTPPIMVVPTTPVIRYPPPPQRGNRPRSPRNSGHYGGGYEEEYRPRRRSNSYSDTEEEPPRRFDDRRRTSADFNSTRRRSSSDLNTDRKSKSGFSFF
jgi:hypothetical protein